MVGVSRARAGRPVDPAQIDGAASRSLGSPLGLLGFDPRIREVLNKCATTKEAAQLECAPPLVLKKLCLIKLDSICRAWSRGASVISRVGSAVGVRILRTLKGCLAAIILTATLLSGTLA